MTEITAEDAEPQSPRRTRQRSSKKRLWIVVWLLALRRFFREIVAEMKKVLWPSQKEMVTYFSVVVVFVVVMITLVALLDLGLAKAVLGVFG